MPHNIIYIINNKLHNNKYKLYTFIFYALIMHSYYILYLNLYNNNYISIFIYFILLLLFYIKFKKFSYIISYIYLLVTLVFIKVNVKENLSLREKVKRKRDKYDAELKADEPQPSNSNSPCKDYILERLRNNEQITIKAPSNSLKPGKIDTSLDLTEGAPDISTRLVD